MFSKIKTLIIVMLIAALGGVAGYTYLTDTVPVLTRSVAQGSEISFSDIGEVRLMKKDINGAVVKDAAYLVGKTATSDIKAGTPVYTFDLTTGTIDELKESGKVIVPVVVENENVPASIAVNDTVHLVGYFAQNEVMGIQAFNITFSQPCMVKGLKYDEFGVLNGLDILVPQEIASEVAMVSLQGRLTVIRSSEESNMVNKGSSASQLFEKYYSANNPYQTYPDQNQNTEQPAE